jgi:very-short-patch-repair endonuclease
VQLSEHGGLDQRIAALSRPHGVIGRTRLLVAGMPTHAVDRRVAAGFLRPIHRGVYAVGPVQSGDASEAAAALACGDRAWISHASAGGLLRVLAKRPRDDVDVTVVARHAPRHRGIRVHRVQLLYRDEVTRFRQIPVTTPARTLLDLATVLPLRELEQAIAEAERRHDGAQRRLLGLLARYPGRAGTAKLRELLGGPRDPAFTRSEAERKFLELVRRAGLPAPEPNVRLHGYEVEFLWRDEVLAVEIDGYAFHHDRSAFEADRRRDADLAAHGIQAIRITWRQITDEPEASLVRLVQALAERARGA